MQGFVKKNCQFHIQQQIIVDLMDYIHLEVFLGGGIIGHEFE